MMSNENSLFINLNDVSSWAALFSIILAMWVVLAPRRRSPEGQEFRGPASAAALVVLLGALFRILFASDLIADEQTWHRRGLEAAEILSTGTIENLGSFGKDGYPYLIGVIYVLIGPAPLVALLINAPIYSALTVYTGKLTSLLLEGTFEPSTARTAARIAAWLTALSPSFVLWAPRLLRETLCTMLIVALLYYSAKFVSTRRYSQLLIALIPAAALVSVRATLALGVILGVIGGLAAVKTSENSSRFLRVMIAAPFVISAFAAVWVYLDANIGISGESAERVRSSNRENASSGYDIDDTEANSGMDIFAYALRAIAGPFPFEWSAQPVMLLAMQEGALWILIAACAIRALKLTMENRASSNISILLFAVAVALILMFGYRLSNYGILARMRPMGHAVLIPLAAAYVAQVWKARQPVAGVIASKLHSRSAGA